MKKEKRTYYLVSFIMFFSLFNFMIMGKVYAEAPVAGFGNALEFDGFDDYINISNGGIKLGQKFTEEAWIYPTESNSNEFRGFIGNEVDLSCVQKRSPGIWTYKKTEIHVGFGDGENWISTITVNTVLKVGTWNHVAVTYDGSVYKIYVNGNLVLSQKFDKTSLDTPVITIGKVNNFFKGYMDEIRLWNIDLPQDKIISYMNRDIDSNHPNYTNLLGYWQFNENSGTATKNSKNNSSDVFGGSPTWCTSTIPQRFYVNSGESIPVYLIGYDKDGNPLTYNIVTNPLHGTVNGDGSQRTYTNNGADEAVSDTITYKVNNGTDSVNTATIEIIVNQKPMVSDFSKSGNTEISFTQSDFINHFRDAENQILQQIKITDTSGLNGILKLGNTQINSGSVIQASELANLKFVPNINLNGNTSFKWSAYDGSAWSSASSVTITIAKADGPSAPSAPAMKSKTHTSVTLDVNALYEYSKDNGATWQDSGVFTGLTASTEYTFVARVKETSTTNASVASAGTKITTDAAPYIPPYIPPTPVPDPKPDQTTIKGDVIDKNGESVKGVEAQVSTETNGNKTVEVKSKDAILVKQPDGTKATLADISKLKLEVKDNAKVSISADGTIQVKDLAKGTETKISVTYDLGNGQKICMGTMEVKVDSNGNVSLTSTLIDPYGTITDAATGKVIEGADVKLYYANTDRNKANGKTPDTLVTLPIIDGFKPNNNKNPQVSDVNGAYGFMVFPTSDYYIVASKDGYNEFKSPTISVEQDIVKFDFKMNKPSTGLDRLSGLNRVDTAIEIAKKSYTGKLSNVILATADGYSDALAGSVLAYKLNAPILLVGSSAADQEKVLAYIKANMDGAGTVYILGGTGAVTSAFEANVLASGFKNITRLGGTNRYETALKIADKLDTKVGTPVVLAYGEDYPDALSISPAAAVMQYPILLVEKDKISDAVKQKLAEIKPTKVYIIGLQGVISTSVEDQVIQVTALTKEKLVRIGGQDRYETSLAVAKYFGLNGQNVCIATGNNYPDALAGSVYAANTNSPIILTGGNLSDNAINYLKTRTMTGATIFGGAAVVSKDVEKKLSELIVK